MEGRVGMHFYNKQLVWFNTTINISPTVIGCGHDTDSWLFQSSLDQLPYAKSLRVLEVHIEAVLLNHTGRFTGSIGLQAFFSFVGHSQRQKLLNQLQALRERI